MRAVLKSALNEEKAFRLIEVTVGFIQLVCDRFGKELAKMNLCTVPEEKAIETFGPLAVSALANVFLLAESTLSYLCHAAIKNVGSAWKRGE